MAYVIKDPVPIAVATYIEAAAFKNKVLQYMPRITIDGVECLASLIYYNWKHHWYVSEKYYADLSDTEKAKAHFHPTETHSKLYKVFGINIATIREQDHSQLEEAWFSFEAPNHGAIELTNTQISDYIKEFSPMIYPTHTDVFNPVNNPCPVLPVTNPITPCIYTNLNPDTYLTSTYETRIVTEAYTDNFGNSVPAVTEEVLVTGPQWDSMGWRNGVVVYQPVTGLFRADNGQWSTGAPYKTDAEIINEIANLTYGRYIIGQDKLTLIALLDTANEVFEKSYSVRREITYTANPAAYTDEYGMASYQPSLMVTTIYVAVKFRRISNVISNTLLTKVQAEVARVEANRSLSEALLEDAARNADWGTPIIDPIEQFRAKLEDGGRTEQIMDMFNHMVTEVDNALVKWVHSFGSYPLSPNDGEGDVYTVGNSYGHYRVDALEAMHPTKVRVLLAPNLTSGYRAYKKKAATFSLETLFTAVLVVAGMILVAYTGQVWLLAAYALAVAVAAVTLARMGMTSLAQNMIQISQLYGYASTAVGIANIVTNAAKEAAKESLLEMAKQKAIDVVVSIKDVVLDPIGAATKFIGQSTLEILNQTVNFLNQAFSVYANYINPPNKGVGELQDQLAATEKELAESEVVRPDSIDTVNKELDDPYNNWMDIPEKMQLMPYHMTTGKNVVLMSKYYDSGY